MLRWLECKGMGTLISAMLLLEKWSLCTAHHSLARNIQNTVGQGDLQGQAKTAYILARLEKSNGMMVITWNWKLGVRCDGYR
jgi:hypothetical protein